MRKTVALNGKNIGEGNPIYVIAEIGGNFTDFDTARRQIDLAKTAGVDAVKFQHYRADTVTSKVALFEMENTGVVSQYELFKKYELGEELTGRLFEYCRSQSITAFSTPSHKSDVDFLKRYNPPAYKIGSDDAVNIPLLSYIAALNIPVLISTGMCTLLEVEQSLDAILKEGNDQLVVFHCTTSYPTHADAVNLRAITTMQERFQIPIGYSDHTLGTDACYAAAVLGAHVLEFHFTHDKLAEGPDHMLSKDPVETGGLVKKLRELYTMLGDGVKRPMPSEMNTRRNNRKSLVVTKDIAAGEKFSLLNFDIKRPGYGIPCCHYYEVLGKTASRNLTADAVLKWDDLA